MQEYELFRSLLIIFLILLTVLFFFLIFLKLLKWKDTIFIFSKMPNQKLLQIIKTEKIAIFSLILSNDRHCIINCCIQQNEFHSEKYLSSNQFESLSKKKGDGLSVRRTMLSAKRLSAKTISAQRNILWPIRWSLHWRKSHFPNGFPCMKTGRFHHNITRLFTRLSNEPVNLPLLIKKIGVLCSNEAIWVVALQLSLFTLWFLDFWVGRNRVDRKRLTFSKLSIKDEGSKKSLLLYI